MPEESGQVNRYFSKSLNLYYRTKATAIGVKVLVEDVPIIKEDGTKLEIENDVVYNEDEISNLVASLRNDGNSKMEIPLLAHNVKRIFIGKIVL